MRVQELFHIDSGEQVDLLRVSYAQEEYSRYRKIKTFEPKEKKVL